MCPIAIKTASKFQGGNFVGCAFCKMTHLLLMTFRPDSETWAPIISCRTVLQRMDPKEIWMFNDALRQIYILLAYWKLSRLVQTSITLLDVLAWTKASSIASFPPPPATNCLPQHAQPIQLGTLCHNDAMSLNCCHRDYLVDFDFCCFCRNTSKGCSDGNQEDFSCCCHSAAVTVIESHSPKDHPRCFQHPLRLQHLCCYYPPWQWLCLGFQPIWPVVAICNYYYATLQRVT